MGDDLVKKMDDGISVMDLQEYHAVIDMIADKAEEYVLRDSAKVKDANLVATIIAAFIAGYGQGLFFGNPEMDFIWDTAFQYLDACIPETEEDYH